MSNDFHDITNNLLAWKKGEQGALDRLLPAIYDELRLLAERSLAGKKELTLQPTALVNEFYLRYLNCVSPESRPIWEDRSHFFSIAATVMRRILVDHWRYKHAERRGGAIVAVEFDEAMTPDASGAEVDVLVLDQALTKLHEIAPQQTRIVELRFFAGLTFEEIGRLLELNERTIKRKWKAARLWLMRELAANPKNQE